MNKTQKVLFYLLLITPLIGGVNDFSNDLMVLRYTRFFLLIFITFFTFYSHTNSISKFPSFKKYFFYYLYLFVCIVSIFFAIEKTFALYKLFEIIILFFLIWRMFQLNHNFLFKEMIRFFEFTLMITLITALISPEVGFNQIPSIFPYQLKGSYFSLNPNDVGFLSCFVLVYLTYNTIKLKKKSYFKIIFFLIILFLSQSRIFIFSYFLFSFFIIPKTIKYFFIVLIPFAFDSIFEFFTPFFIRDKSISELSSINGRIFFWEEGINSFLENPWLGKGFYTGHRFLFEINKNSFFNSSTFDNTYIDILNDNGIIGLSILSIFLIKVLVTLIKYNKLFFILWLLVLLRAFFGPSFQVIHPILPIFYLLMISTIENKNKFYA